MLNEVNDCCEEAICGNIEYTEEPLSVKIKADGTEYTFNRRTASFDSIKHDGTEILDNPMQFNFFRAPTDNDIMKHDWYKAHLNDYIVKVYSTEVTDCEGGVEIRVKQSFGWSIHQPFARADVVYTICGDGELNVNCDVEMSEKIEFLPRFGLRLFVLRIRSV